MNYSKLFGARIQKIRKARKLNQQKLAARVGIEAKYLSLIETGRQQPAFAKIVAIAEALDVPVCDLFLDDGEDQDQKVKRRKLEVLLNKAQPSELNQLYKIARILIEP